MKIFHPGEIDSAFFRFCAQRKPDVICDVGTRDCHDAIRMKQASPSSMVFAFEANPENYFEYCLLPNVVAFGIQVQHIAVSDTTGSAVLRVPTYASRKQGGSVQQRGISSLLARTETCDSTDYVVPQTRLDSFFAGLTGFQSDKTFAFWIDVEGLAYQVLSGMKEIIDKTVAIKVEVEEKEYFSGQHRAQDVINMMTDIGWPPVACGDPTPGQYDILFIRENYLDGVLP